MVQLLAASLVRHQPMTNRFDFVDLTYHKESLIDSQIPIGFGMNSTRPSVVQNMVSELIKGGDLDNVLEIGTGCGYQTAVLSKLFKKVYTIECIPDLQKRAKRTLESLNHKNIEYHIGDGHLGWPEDIKFSHIISGTCFKEIPDKLLEQYTKKIVLPLGDEKSQAITVITPQEIKEIGPAGFTMAKHEVCNEKNYRSR